MTFCTEEDNDRTRNKRKKERKKEREREREREQKKDREELKEGGAKQRKYLKSKIDDGTTTRGRTTQ